MSIATNSEERGTGLIITQNPFLSKIPSGDFYPEVRLYGVPIVNGQDPTLRRCWIATLQAVFSGTLIESGLLSTLFASTLLYHRQGFHTKRRR